MDIYKSSGRRKKSIARVYIKAGKGNISVNKKDYKAYFTDALAHYKITQPFVATNTELKQYDVKVNAIGGGINGQVEATRLAIAKALLQINEENRPLLRQQGLLTRDPRMVERKKFGQKKARKKYQFSKR